jgi:hypothetical protein
MAMLMEKVQQTASPSPSSSAEPFGDSEAWCLFEATAQQYLGISGNEFLARWDSGYYSGPHSEAGAMRVAFLIPLVRTTVARKKSR